MDDIRSKMSVREASRISGIPLSLFYYRPRKRSVTRLNQSVVEDALRVASERPTYGYRRVWAVLRKRRNCNQSEISQEGAEDQQSLPSLCQAQGQNKIQEPVPSHGTRSAVGNGYH